MTVERVLLGGLAVAIRDYKGGVVMISHNEEFVGALCPEQWHVDNGRLTQKGHLAVSMDRFDDSSRPGSSLASSAVASSNVSSAAPSTNGTPAGSGDEGGEKTTGVNANLWAGIGLLVVGLGFIAWSLLRPVVVPEHVAGPDDLPPVLVQHGTLDPMVPIERGRKVTADLTSRGLAVRHLEYPMEHQLALESVQDAHGWLDAVVAGERPSSPPPS